MRLHPELAAMLGLRWRVAQGIVILALLSISAWSTDVLSAWGCRFCNLGRVLQAKRGCVDLELCEE